MALFLTFWIPEIENLYYVYFHFKLYSLRFSPRLRPWKFTNVTYDFIPKDIRDKKQPILTSGPPLPSLDKQTNNQINKETKKILN